MKLPLPWTLPASSKAAAGDDAGPETLPARVVPVLWLLGKTGAGKSSLVRALTNLPEAEVGDGFVSCTKTARAFSFPADRPLVEFLDTRGLGETGYDPAEDIAECDGRANAVLAVARLDDPVQGALIDVLREVRRRRPRLSVILVLTGADQIPDAAQRTRVAAETTAKVRAAVGPDLICAEAAVPPDGLVQIDALVEALARVLPSVALLLNPGTARGEEARRFAEVKPRVLAFATMAGSSDLAPLIGAVSVPSTQAAMLAWLARSYGVEWSARMAASFIGTLGGGIAARYAALFGLRQVGKMIPVLGQTAVAAASGTVSFASTFAIGRAAAFYFHHQSRGNTVADADLRKVYADALRGGLKGSDG